MKTSIPNGGLVTGKKIRTIANTVCVGAHLWLILSAGVAQAANYIVVARAGDGVQNLTSSVGDSLFLDEFTASGMYLGTINVPSSGASALIADASATQQSPELWTSLRLSTNGQYLIFPGFNVSYPSGAGLSSASSSAVPRGIGRVDMNGVYSLAVSDNTLYSGNTFRSAVSRDGLSEYWTSGSSRGVEYLSQPNADVPISGSGAPGAGNVRDLGIFNSALYASTQAGTNYGLYIFDGPPIGPDMPNFLLSYNPTNSHPDEFAVSPDGKTIYLADDGVGGGVGGGIERWDYNGSSWINSYILPTGDVSSNSPVGARGLTVDFSNFYEGSSNRVGAVIYATTAELFGNRLISITDGGPSSVPVTLSQLTTTNQVYRGVSLWPSVAPPATNCFPAPAGLTNWWTGNSNTVDSIGSDTGIWVNGSGYTIGQGGLDAFSFNGADFLTTQFPINNPQSFTVDLWFKTTTTRGGALFGLAQDQNNDNGQYDRTIYMDNNGLLRFGVWTGSAQLVSSTSRYNDGNWHNVAASESANGAVLYVDGVPLASNPNATPAENFTGYWRIGDNGLNNWPDEPTSTYFTGAIDQVLIYNGPLSPQEIGEIYQAGPLENCPTNCLTLSVLTSNLTFQACSCVPITFSNLVANGQGWSSNILSYTDACCTNVYVYYSPSNYCFPMGSNTTVQVFAYDTCGNEASGQITVTVLPYTVTNVVLSGQTVFMSNPLNNGNDAANIVFPNPDPAQNYSGPRDFDELLIYNCANGTFEPVYFDSVTADTTTGFVDENDNPVPAPILGPGCGFGYVNNQTGTETNVFTGCPGSPGGCYCGCGTWSCLDLPGLLRQEVKPPATRESPVSRR